MKNQTNRRSAFVISRFVAAFALFFLSAALIVFAFSTRLERPQLAEASDKAESGERLERDMPTLGENPGDEAKDLQRLEQYWADRVTYPTGKFDPQWLRNAAAQHARMQTGIPAGNFPKIAPSGNLKGGKATQRKGGTTGPTLNPPSLSTTGFTALGPKPESMTGCSGCFNYTTTEGRVNAIVVDPTTTTNGSIVAYLGSVGGGVWKTTNCCSNATTWNVTTDEPLISTIPIDTITIDPNNHNTVYAGTGDLNYGSFSMGSQGILKSTDAGNTWTVLGATVFGVAYPEPAGNYPQYNAVGKVRVDPNNSHNVLAGTKLGLYVSNDAGNTWTQCPMNSFTSQRQDVTGLELTNIGGSTRVIAAVGTRGFATPVQYDLGNNGANGIYSATLPASGCPTFTAITTNANGFIYGTGVTTASGGAGYTTGQAMNADSGSPYVSVGSGNQLGRIDIGIAPSNPNVIYAQVGSIAPNNNSGGGGGGCANGPGCQLGAWTTSDGGNTWTFMAGSAGGTLRQCNSTGVTNSTATGDYPQNWYDQAVAVDPNDPTRVFFDTYEIFFATQGGTTWYDTTCAYTQSTALGMHADEHVLTFVPGSSSILITGCDGGVDATTNANAASLNTARPTWFNMDGGLNTIEFYSGDISANFATSATPMAVGGAQDNGPSSVMFTGAPTGPAQWQMGLGGDGFSGLIDSTGGTPSQAQGTITLVTGGAAAGQQFVVGTQTFTFQTAARSGVGQVTLNSSTTTEGNNIVTALNADLPGQVTSARSGATVVVTAAQPGSAGNSIPFSNINSANFTMNGTGTLGGTTMGGIAGSTAPLFFEGNNSGGFSRCASNCTSPGASWSSKQGGWTGDTQSFVLPVNLFHGGIPGGDDCPNGCGHILAGTTRVWETITGASTATAWYVTNNPITTNMTKQSLGNRSYINQVKYSPKYQSVAIAGTNDGNVQIGFNLGTAAQAQATWVDVTGGNTVLPNRPINGISLDPSVGSVATPVGYAAVGGFNANTPTTPGHVFQVTCVSSCSSFNWVDKTGNLPDIPVDSVINNPNYPQQVFAGTDWGLYYTNDITSASPVWYRFESGLPHAMIWDLNIDRGSTTLSAWTRSRGAYVFPLPSSAISPAPVLVSAASRLTHGGAGTFDLSLPINGTAGVEPRDGSGNFMIVLTFDQPITAGGATVTNGSGTTGGVTYSGNSILVPLSGVADQQTTTVSVSGASGAGTLPTAFSIDVSFLIGDVNGDGVVNIGDSAADRGNSGATLDNTNFQYDVNLDGFINVGDSVIVRSKSGDFLH